jgi:serine/threonine protein kinase
MIILLTRASNNQPVSLTKQLASSGEGEVWETNLNGHLAKIYHNPTIERIEKLKVMLANPPADPMLKHNHISIAWPKELLKDSSGNYVGFLMSAIKDSRELPSVYHPSLRKKKAPGFNWYYLHVTALNTAWIIQAIHDKGYVLGDIKPQNILVNDRALVAVIDTDSFQVRDSQTRKVYRCTVGSEGFTPVELLGQDFTNIEQTEVHDRFRLAVLIHYLLFGYHPFSGEWKGSGDSPEQTELIRNGYWYGGQNSLIGASQNTIPLDVVHPEVKRLFLKCFNEGHSAPHLRPTAEDWHNVLQVAVNELTVCGKIDSHHYSRTYGKCYWCERAANLGVDIFPGIAGTASLPKLNRSSNFNINIRGTGTKTLNFHLKQIQKLKNPGKIIIGLGIGGFAVTIATLNLSDSKKPIAPSANSFVIVPRTQSLSPNPKFIDSQKSFPVVEIEEDKIKAEQAEIEIQRKDREHQIAIKAETKKIAIIATQKSARAEQAKLEVTKKPKNVQTAIRTEQARHSVITAEQQRRTAIKSERFRQASIKAEKTRLKAAKKQENRQAAIKAEQTRQAAIQAQQQQQLSSLPKQQNSGKNQTSNASKPWESPVIRSNSEDLEDVIRRGKK